MEFFILQYQPFTKLLVSQIGKTKVFLRAGQMAELDARRAEVLGNAARTIQRQIRTYIARKEFIALRKTAICLQSHCRGIFLRTYFKPFLSCIFLLFNSISRSPLLWHIVIYIIFQWQTIDLHMCLWGCLEYAASHVDVHIFVPLVSHLHWLCVCLWGR